MEIKLVKTKKFLKNKNFSREIRLMTIEDHLVGYFVKINLEKQK